ncbi:MAG: TonB-dependent receptor [Gammaproteobacteria bacterium]|nr:TonB-dependent receptor [Gammaproteobacteria bacterium]
MAPPRPCRGVLSASSTTATPRARAPRGESRLQRHLQGAYRFDYSDTDQWPDTPICRARTILPFLAPYVTHDRDAPVSVDAPTFERSRTLGHSFTLTWDVNDTNTLKSITAYRQLRWNDLLDLDGSPLPVAHTARSTGGRDWSYNAASQELQLVGHTERFNYVGGLYYFKDSGFTYGPQNFFFNTFNFESDYGYGTKAWAAYGQADYKVTDAWTVTGGVRYTREKKELERYLGVRFDLTSPFFALTPLGTTAEHTFSATTPVLIVSYKFSDTVNAYAKYSQGFKSGGFNGEYSEVPSDFTNPAIVSATIANNIAESRTPFRPEKLKSYELGLKTSFADGRATVNVAAFENKTDDMQLSIFTAAGAAGSIIRNAGKATTRGVEIEATWAPSDALRLQASYGYLDAKYDRFMDAGVNEADNRAMIHAPKNTINLLADARIVRTALGDLRGTLDYSWTDDYYTYPYQLASSGPNYNPLRAIAGDTRVKSYGC